GAQMPSGYGDPGDLVTAERPQFAPFERGVDMTASQAYPAALPGPSLVSAPSRRSGSVRRPSHVDVTRVPLLAIPSTAPTGPTASSSTAPMAPTAPFVVPIVGINGGAR